MRSRKSLPKDEAPAGATILSVRIQPRASKNEIRRMENGCLKIRLSAPPVDGAANEALLRFLAELLSVSQSRIEIISGHSSRNKIVRISGMSKTNAEGLLYSQEKWSSILKAETRELDADRRK
jgi:uncharacterized protein (TIGR00251 family)